MDQVKEQCRQIGAVFPEAVEERDFRLPGIERERMEGRTIADCDYLDSIVEQISMLQAAQVEGGPISLKEIFFEKAYYGITMIFHRSKRMYKTARIILCAVSIGVFFPARAAQNAVVEQRRAEIVAKADSLFRQRYSPKSTVPLVYDKESATGPPDGPIYWFDASYVVQLMFAGDGSLALVKVLPEALLYSKSWMSVKDKDNVELGKGELHWLLDTVNRLQPLGDPIQVLEPPNGCFQSSANLYCEDSYKEAVVDEALRVQSDKDKSGQLLLKSATIAYKQLVVGTVSELNVLSPAEHRVKIGPLWYRIVWSNEKLFHDAVVGSVVKLTTFGCATNRVLCEVLPQE